MRIGSGTWRFGRRESWFNRPAIRILRVLRAAPENRFFVQNSPFLLGAFLDLIGKTRVV
jgi:hypothetical protein